MRKLNLAGALVATLAACADGASPPPRVPENLRGAWEANAACAPPCTFTLTWLANPQARLDAINLGMALRMDIEANGSFRFGDVTALPPAGTVRVLGQQLIVTDAQGVVDTIDYRFEGQALRLDFRRVFAVLDFNADGVKDPSSASAVFVRR